MKVCGKVKVVLEDAHSTAREITCENTFKNCFSACTLRLVT